MSPQSSVLFQSGSDNRSSFVFHLREVICCCHKGGRKRARRRRGKYVIISFFLLRYSPMTFRCAGRDRRLLQNNVIFNLQLTMNHKQLAINLSGERRRRRRRCSSSSSFSFSAFLILIFLAETTTTLKTNLGHAIDKEKKRS